MKTVIPTSSSMRVKVRDVTHKLVSGELKVSKPTGRYPAEIINGAFKAAIQSVTRTPHVKKKSDQTI